MLIDCIFCKDGSTRKAEALAILEEVDNVLVALAEVAAVALVKNHDDALALAVLYLLVVAVTCDGHIKFLYRRDDDFAVAAQPLDQFTGAVGAIDGTRLKRLILALRLRVEVVPVNDEHHLVNAVHFAHELRSLKGCECFAGPRCMPDVTVLVRVLHPVKDFLHSIVLIGAQHHQTLVALMQYDVFTDHLADGAAVKEHRSKEVQVIERIILLVRPVERELVALVRVVGEVTGVNAIRNHEDLDIVKQAMERSLVITLYLVVGLFQLNAAFLQFNLDKRQSIDEDGDIISAFLAALNRYLVAHLELVLAPLLAIEELDPDAFAVLGVEREQVTQFLRFVETGDALAFKKVDGTVVETRATLKVNEDAVKLCIREMFASEFRQFFSVVLFQLSLEVGVKIRFL